MNDFKKITDFLEEMEGIKRTIRFDSVKNRLNESTADHSWKLAMMVFVITEELDLKIDRYKAVKLALIHDLGGNIDYRTFVLKNLSKKEKLKKEDSAFKEMTKTLPLKTNKQLAGLWREFREKSSEEAKFVRALEKIETLSHVCVSGYKTYNNPEIIPNYADEAVKEFPVLVNILSEIKKRLKIEFKKGDILWKKEYD